MAYVAYSNIKTPDEAIQYMYDYVVARGYQIVEPLSQDLNIYDMSSVDGKKFVFKDRTDTYYIIIRSANGINIFGTNNSDEMDAKAAEVGIGYYGIGMTISEGYSSTQRWYDQFLVPVSKASKTLGDGTKSKDVLGVWIPLLPRDGAIATEQSDSSKYYTLFCNNITTPSDTLVFTIMGELGSGDILLGWDRRCVTMICGNLFKYEDWTGGAFMSASSVPSLCSTAYKIFSINETGNNPLYTVLDNGILPPLSSGAVSNTFLRIDIDDAITDVRGNIRWACSGTDNVTGKPMSLPVRVGTGNGVVPHYKPLQSTSSTDWGRNINTLNCITLNMPHFMAVRVDPDALNNYACAGQVTGVYYVCNLNMQSGEVYEQDYPNSNDTDQIFSFSMRRGRYGFDALSIRQKLDDSESVYGDITIDTHHTTG